MSQHQRKSIKNSHLVMFCFGVFTDAYTLHDSGVPPTTPNGKSPAKIGARNSSFASFDLGVGVRLRRRPSQPDAKARSRGRNTRITRADFRWVFSCSGWVSYKPHRKRDELFVFVQNLYIINIDDVAASVMSKQLQRVREGQSFVIIISIYIYSIGITDHGIYFILFFLCCTRRRRSASQRIFS